MRARDGSSAAGLEQKQYVTAADNEREFSPGEQETIIAGIEGRDPEIVLEMYHHSNGTILELNGLVEEAIKEYREVISLNPAEGFYHYNLGVALLKNNEYNDAYKELSEAIRMDPENLEACYALADVNYAIGNSLMLEGRFEEATGAFREAIAIDTGYASYHHGLGTALFEMARKIATGTSGSLLYEAISEFRFANRLEPENRAVCINLGRALAMSSVQDFHDVVKMLQEILIEDPLDDEARSCLYTLQRRTVE
ncbi:MAG TPA: tetratricopeptide repeat protein [Methanocella sp.]|nr:tetratricopeptide repeat protein [Methanocella sp.]